MQWLGLLKYHSRMCTRSTPFGLFAGVSVGAIGDRTHFAIEGLGRFLRYSRLDSERLLEIVDTLHLSDQVLRNSEWTVNSTLTLLSDQWRYIQKLSGAANSEHRLAAIPDSELMRAVVDLRQFRYGELHARLLLLDPDFGEDETFDFFRELVGHQIVESNLRPPVTGMEPLSFLVAQLAAANLPNDKLSLLDRAIRALDAQPFESGVTKYADVEGILKQCCPERASDNLFQVDVVAAAESLTLSSSTIAEITRIAPSLLMLGVEESEELKKFRIKLEERYDNNWVPLLEALDEEKGIGFIAGALDTPLIKGLQLRARRAETAASVTTTAWDQKLIERVEDAWRDGRMEVVLAEQDLRDCERGRPPSTGTTCSAHVSLFDGSVIDKTVQCGVQLLSIGGRSATDLLGRFCHASYDLFDHAKYIASLEQSASNDAVLVEVCHLAQDRAGNVVLRPRLREYELPYLGRASAVASHQITADDLLVSVRGDQIFLYSKRLKRLVRPMMATAHNFSRSRIALYRFLGHFQFQSTRSFAFNWPQSLSRAKFLPRVRVGPIVLKPAQWRLSIPATTPRDRRASAAEAVLTDKRNVDALPRLICVREGDQVLTLDLNLAAAREILSSLLASRTSIVAEETFVESSLLKGPGGTFANEVVLPLSWKIRVETSTEPPLDAAPRVDERRVVFPPGSDWVYVKLYCGPLTADRVLVELVRPLIDHFMSTKVATTWFFIRYSDPDYHLRIRVRVTDTRNVAVVRERFDNAIAPWIHQGNVWRVQYDTYAPELERYGGSGLLAVSERLFACDSDAIVEAMHALPQPQSEDLRWRLAVVSADRWLKDFDLALHERLAFVKRTVASFQNEFHMHGHQHAVLSKRYRELRDRIVGLISNAEAEEGALPAIRSFVMRSKVTKAILAPLAASSEVNRRLAILPSIIHMSINRICLTAPREHEFIVYEFMRRAYETLLKKTDRSEREMSASL